MDRRRGKNAAGEEFFTQSGRSAGVRPIAAGSEWSTLTIIAELAAVFNPAAEEGELFTERRPA